MASTAHLSRRSYGIIGGLGPLASADVFFKLMQAMAADGDLEQADVIFEQHPFRGSGLASTATTERKLYVFDMIRDFEKRGAGAVVLPCFLSHTFLDELRANTTLPIVDMMAALAAHVRQAYPQATRIGVLSSDYTRAAGLFERYFPAPSFDVLYPHAADGVNPVAEAVYGEHGIKRGNLTGRPLQLLTEAAHDLAAQGAQVILPGLTEVALVAHALGALPAPLVDSNQVYARSVAAGRREARTKPFKVGVVGGVGPAATVDFMQKIVRNTPAARDQEHIKVHVEQNPQIPDRTENLIGHGPDPTIALYATCRKLEDGGADLIAIPCNTAHAYVERIQPSLSIPIVNMLTVTVHSIRERFPQLTQVGLLATSGTLGSGVYQKALEEQGLQQLAPSPAAQEHVMEAIYGREGVKAGFTEGRCQDDIRIGLDDLVRQGAELVILGCTELPLLLPFAQVMHASGKTITLVDPTDTLARRCVEYAGAGMQTAEHNAAR
ncbi:aspartate/glutamate racemase family protein [Herbaspirillum sp. LeCh32-8]|uniref:aspartate/glutamate racemase family protein n=1 Tax=Herbaspirillum sp. LeCh32-8 TaxID=2821356 RepID=UPI001AE54A1C|nr:amino acid racemase [Herbaspirillum sp. LeCh32-8]MBP0598911.1 aspartate/glutamate racemase family protein [Herbaspirillum sp. LeCh32-8]